MRFCPLLSKYIRSRLKLLLCVAAVLMLTACTSAPAETIPAETMPPTQPQITRMPVNTIFFSFIEDEVTLCSDSAKQVYDRRKLVSEVIDQGNPYRPFRFEYCLVDTEGTLLLGESSDLSDARIYPLDPESRSLTIDNLKTDTTYYYQIVTEDSVYPGSFRTVRSTRFVSIPGVRNTRDIGGYKNLDGKTVRQGLLIRGGELDGLQTGVYKVSEENLAAAADTFGFAWEMDLRSSSLAGEGYASPLGPEVGHRFYSAPMYAQIFNPSYYSSLRQIFRDLADPEKYPIYLHCAWGQDRAGTVVFLLQGVLNMSHGDMIREYRLSGYNDPIFADGDRTDEISSRMANYQGDTLQEQIVSYLKNVIGITDAEIESIRTIFLEE